MKAEKENRFITDHSPEERKKTLDRELNRYLQLLTKYSSPEKIILFGTMAGEEQIHDWSDIDLVIIEKTKLPFFQRLRKVRKLLRPKVGADILVYTPEEFDLLCQERQFFKEEILAKGRVIYESCQ